MLQKTKIWGNDPRDGQKSQNWALKQNSIWNCPAWLGHPVCSELISSRCRHAQNCPAVIWDGLLGLVWDLYSQNIAIATLGLVFRAVLNIHTVEPPIPDWKIIENPLKLRINQVTHFDFERDSIAYIHIRYFWWTKFSCTPFFNFNTQCNNCFWEFLSNYDKVQNLMTNVENPKSRNTFCNLGPS